MAKKQRGFNIDGSSNHRRCGGVILIALAVSLFAGSSESSPSSLLLKKVLFFVLIALASKRTIPKVTHVFSKFKVTEPLLSGALIICFSFAYLAEYLGVAGIIGSFFAGVSMSQTTFKDEIERKVEPIVNGIFVPFFFVSIGLSVTFQGIDQWIGFVFIFSLIAIASKFIGSGVDAGLADFSRRSSMDIMAGMVSHGEVALILVVIGLETGLVAIDYYTSIILVIIVSTIVTPPMLKILYDDGSRELSEAQSHNNHSL